MKKKMIILSLIIVVALITVVINKSYANKTYVNYDGIKLAITNGSGGTLSAIPAKGKYEVTVDCLNANGSWDYLNWKIVIKDINGAVACDLDFKPVSTMYLANFIKGSYSTQPNPGTGNSIVNENGYRYEGRNPNNYVWFNNELWRILGVFSTEYDTTNNGSVDTTNDLVKLIRAVPIGGFAWDNTNTYGINDWPNSKLYNLLNGAYYNWNANKSTVSNYCWGYSNVVPKTCDFTLTGIQDGYRNMIVKAKWYLGGPGASGYQYYVTSYLYSFERNASSVYSGRSASTLGYVGLMYLSDYGYSVNNTDCDKTNTMVLTLGSDNPGYASIECAGSSWLTTVGDEWFITPFHGDDTEAFKVQGEGGIYVSRTRADNRVRPVVYLNSTVYLLTGTGTIDDPYIIGM